MQSRRMRIYSAHTRRELRHRLRHIVYVINLILVEYPL